MTSSSSSSLSTPAIDRLAAVVLEANTLGPADLRTRLLWIERAADAAEAVDLDDGGQAALHLRAALGAIVKWSQGDKNPDSLVELDALVRLLMARAQLGLLRGLAGFYDRLVEERAPHRAAAAETRDVLIELARAVEKGTAVPGDVQARLAAIAASLSG